MAAAIDRSTISGATPWNSSPAPFLISRSCEGWRWRSPANYSPVLYYLSRNSVSGAICCSRLSGVQLRSTSRASVLGNLWGEEGGGKGGARRRNLNNLLLRFFDRYYRVYAASRLILILAKYRTSGTISRGGEGREEGSGCIGNCIARSGWWLWW